MVFGRYLPFVLWSSVSHCGSITAWFSRPFPALCILSLCLTGWRQVSFFLPHSIAASDSLPLYILCYRLPIVLRIACLQQGYSFLFVAMTSLFQLSFSIYCPRVQGLCLLDDVWQFLLSCINVALEIDRTWVFGSGFIYLNFPLPPSLYPSVPTMSARQ